MTQPTFNCQECLLIVRNSDNSPEIEKDVDGMGRVTFWTKCSIWPESGTIEVGKKHGCIDFHGKSKPF